MSPTTKDVALWVAGLRHEHVPENVRAALRLLALDTVGAALVGAAQPWTQAIRAWAMAAAPGPASVGRARIWGENRGVLRAADAALVNGASAHAYELDDFHNAKLHPGAVVLPAALALGEALDADGARVETALAAGYEVMIRTALALGPSAARLRGWHLTGVCGTLGAAAAGAVLLGLDAEQTAWALGLAGTQSSGLFAFNEDGSSSKRLHPGRAAQSGVMAAEMAALGLSGPTSVYEAEDGGMLRAFVDKPDASRLTDGLGAQWHAAETSFKPYSCCGSLHAHVDAALALRKLWRPGGRVRLGVARVIEVQCGYPYDPGSDLNAQMSARYCAAVALLDGQALPAQFSAARIADPALTKLARAVEIVHDPAHDSLYPGKFCGWAEVETAGGKLQRVEVMNPSGNPENPEMAEKLRGKFSQLVAPVIGDNRSALVQASFARLGEISARHVVDAVAV
jgi:2-methylcitrate dehydratase PrpD